MQVVRWSYINNAAIMRFLAAILILSLSITAFGSGIRPVATGRTAHRALSRPSGTRLAANKCVFVLATAHSGSNALMDALNQIPNYLIRGENWAAHLNLFHAYQRLSTLPRAPGQSYINWAEHRHASFQTVKSLYEGQASSRNLPFFTEFQIDRVIIATRLYYNVLYGRYGDGVVSGFKEIRYVCGISLDSNKCEEHFSQFLAFLRRLCIHVKVLLLTRSLHTYYANPGIFEGLAESLRQKTEKDLEKTHEVYDAFVERYPEVVFRVHTEDMFD
ncbi:hypothetical protein Agub_g7928, partial [Astrephomene gubernaculifera]